MEVFLVSNRQEGLLILYNFETLVVIFLLEIQLRGKDGCNSYLVREVWVDFSKNYWFQEVLIIAFSFIIDIASVKFERLFSTLERHLDRTGIFLVASSSLRNTQVADGLGLGTHDFTLVVE